MAILRAAAYGAAILIALGALTSCATLNESECQTADWRALGSTDGAAGRPAGHIARHHEACARFSLPVDEQSWRAGWDEGIRAYCTPANALSEGRRGRNYANSCPAALAPAFEDAYRVARRAHDAEEEARGLRAEIDTLIRRRALARDRDEARHIGLAISLRRSALFSAETRQWSTERDYQRYRRELRRGV